MSHAQITSKGTWYRRIHDTWSNASGYRTDIPQSVLEGTLVMKVAYILDDHRAIIVPIEAVRSALRQAPRRGNGCVGPYYVDPHRGKLNGVLVPMEIRLLPASNQAA